MFQDSLVESSPEKRKRSRWPLATAFTTQVFVAGALLLLPMFSIGVIPLAQHIPLFTQLAAPQIVEASSPRTPPDGGGGGVSYPRQVVLAGGSGSRNWLLPPTGKNDGPDAPPDIHFGSGGNGLPIGDGPGKGNGPGVRLEEEKKRPRFSHLDEGLLTRKVQPVYPVIAIRAGIQGDVKLYAIVSRDGSIENLKLISGHPLLVSAAMDAVKQWKYRPYILNGDPVEVETYITVTFRRGN